MFGSLLINEPPLQVLPTLAKRIGLNEAIITQQVHYWLLRSKNKKDGHVWVYKTYVEWQEEFPFWSESTIKRAITSLEKQNVLISTSKYNKMPMDRTKWYTINYPTLQGQPLGQNDTMLGSDCNDAQVNMTQCSGQNDTKEQVNMTPPITIDYTENTSEITTKTTTDKKPLSSSSEIFNFYESEFGPLSNFIAEEIGYMIEDTNEELVLEALKLSVRANKRTIKYAAAITRNWRNENIQSLADLRAAEKMKGRGRDDKNDGRSIRSAEEEDYYSRLANFSSDDL